MNLRILSSDAIWVLIFFVFTPSNATSMTFSQQILGGKLFLVGKKVMLVLGRIRTNNNLPPRNFCG